MTPLAVVFQADIGPRFGPAALALVLVLAAEGGAATRSDIDFARLLGCSVRLLQDVRTGLVEGGVLTYTAGQRGRPTAYTLVGLVRRGLPPAAVSLAGNASHAAPSPAPAVGAGTAAEEALPPVPAGAAKKARRPQPTDPLFDAITHLSGATASGRVAKLASEMLKAGLTAERLEAEICVVVGRWAAWRKTLDLDTLTACWGWILTPPQEVGGPHKNVNGVHRNGKPAPTNTDRITRAIETASANPLD